MTDEQFQRVQQAREHLAQAMRAFSQAPNPGLASSIGRLRRYIRRHSVTRWNIEFTDTFGGEANYCFVSRFSVNACSMRGAVIVAARHLGYSGRVVCDGKWGDGGRWNIRRAALCFFVSWHDSTAPDAEVWPLVNEKG